MNSSARTALVSLVLIVFIGTAYHRVRGFELTNYDDPAVVLENDFVKGFSVEHLKAAFGETHQYAYLPFYYASYWIDHAIFGENWGGWHVMNVAWHCVAAIAAFCFLSRTTMSRFGAFFAAQVFALHPVVVESVAWVASRKDLVSMVFLLFALIVFQSGLRSGKKSTLIVFPAILLLCGLFAKAAILFAPLAFYLAAKFTEIPDSSKKADGRSVRIALFAMCIVTVAAVAVHFVIARSEGTADVSTESLGSRILWMTGVFAHYMKNLVFPNALSVHYDHPLNGRFGWWEIHGIVLFSALVGFLFRKSTRRTTAFFGIAWMLAALLPFNNVFPRFSIAMADRYLYYAALGFGILLASFVGAKTENPRRRFVQLAFVATVPILLVFVTMTRAEVFRSSETLWRDAVKKSPDAVLPYLQLGHAEEWRAEKGGGDIEELLSEARKNYETALSRAHSPNEEIQALMKICGLEVRVGRYASAIGFFDRLERLLPNSTRPIDPADRDTLTITRSTAHAALGQWQAARDRLAKIPENSKVALESANLDAAIDFLESESRKKDKESPTELSERRRLMERAIDKFRKEIDRHPHAKKSRMDYAKSLLAADWMPDHLIHATNEVSKLVRDFPNEAAPRVLRAQVYIDVDPAQAVADLDFALKKDPFREDWYVLLADYLRKVGQNKKALAVLEKGRKTLPDSRGLARAIAMTWLSFAYHHKNTGDPKAAYDSARRAAETDATFAEPYVAIGEFKEAEASDQGVAPKAAQDAWEEAKSSFEKALAVDPEDPRAKLGLARYYKALGYGLAFEVVRRPKDETPAAAKERKSLLRRRQYEAWSEALRLAGKDESIAVLASLLPTYAKDLVEEAAEAHDDLRNDRAKELIAEALKYDPASVDARELLAIVETSLGNYDRAKIVWQEVLDRDARHLRALYELATLLYDEKAWRRSRELFERFVVCAKADADPGVLAPQIAAAERFAAKAAKSEEEK